MQLFAITAFVRGSRNYPILFPLLVSPALDFLSLIQCHPLSLSLCLALSLSFSIYLFLFPLFSLCPIHTYTYIHIHNMRHIGINVVLLKRWREKWIDWTRCRYTLTQRKVFRHSRQNLSIGPLTNNVTSTVFLRSCIRYPESRGITNISEYFQIKADPLLKLHVSRFQ